MVKFRCLFTLALLVNFISAFAQSDTVFNYTDRNNLKQGYWKKNYPNGKVMYSACFKNDKPVGELKRNFESGALKAVLHYDTSGEYARAKLYYEDGNLAAEGKFWQSLKDSTWKYYSFYNNTLSAVESYNHGAKHGTAVNYYANGEISETTNWENDKKTGSWEQYFAGNVLKLKAYFIDNKLEGPFIVYNPDGKPYISGNYSNNKRNGKWILYHADGTIKSEVIYTDGKAPDNNKLNAEQQEFFKMIDEAQGKFEEPDETNFLIPPGK